jgi:hypothetical protein
MKHWCDCAFEIDETPDMELSREAGFLKADFPSPFLPFPLVCFARPFDFATALTLFCATLSKDDMTLGLTMLVGKRKRRQRALRNGSGGNNDNDELKVKTTWRDKNHMGPNGSPHKFKLASESEK